MSDCCPVKPSVVDKTKVGFIIEKARNFKAFLSEYSPDTTIQPYLDGFDEKMVLPTILTAVVPIVKAGKTESAVLDLMKKLQVPDDKHEEVKGKLIRYMEMFYKVVSS